MVQGVWLKEKDPGLENLKTSHYRAGLQVVGAAAESRVWRVAVGSCTWRPSGIVLGPSDGVRGLKLDTVQGSRVEPLRTSPNRHAADYVEAQSAKGRN